MAEHTTMMSDAEIAAIWKRLENISMAPWRLVWNHQSLELQPADYGVEGDELAEWLFPINPERQSDKDECDTRNQEFMAHAPTDVEALLAALAEARRENAELRERAVRAEGALDRLRDFKANVEGFRNGLEAAIMLASGQNRERLQVAWLELNKQQASQPPQGEQAQEGAR